MNRNHFRTATSAVFLSLGLAVVPMSNGALAQEAPTTEAEELETFEQELEGASPPIDDLGQPSEAQVEEFETTGEELQGQEGLQDSAATIQAQQAQDAALEAQTAAQEAAQNAEVAAQQAEQLAADVDTVEDDDGDWGWLGLLGLIGLFGLAGGKRRDVTPAVREPYETTQSSDAYRR